MSERIRDLKSIDPVQLRSSNLVLCGEGAIRCKNLPTFREIAQAPNSSLVAMSETDLVQGKRGFAKAQILLSLGVEVVSVDEIDIERLVDDQGDTLDRIGEITFGEEMRIFDGSTKREAVNIQSTNDPDDLRFIRVAKSLIQKSECWWRPTACVFERESEVIMGGVSGNPWGTNCKDLAIEPSDISLNPGERISFCNAIHAEKVGIAKAAKLGISLDETHLYVTSCPCEECAKEIIEIGVTRVIFDSEYYNREGLRLLSERGVEFARIKNDES